MLFLGQLRELESQVIVKLAKVLLFRSQDGSGSPPRSPCIEKPSTTNKKRYRKELRVGSWICPDAVVGGVTRVVLVH